MPRNTPPNPRQALDALHRIETLAPQVAENLRWAVNLGYDKPRGKGAQATEVKVSGTSDPAGDVATIPQLRVVREKTDEALRLVYEAAAKLIGAEFALARVSAMMGANETTAIAAFHDPSPRMVTKGELAEAQRAKEKREARGEGWGSG